MDYIRAIERQDMREDIPQVRVGDNVKVHYRIKEGDREAFLRHRCRAHLPASQPQDRQA